MTWRGRLGLLVLYVAAVLPGAALAVDHALLIGVSDYTALPRRLRLRGPNNDVALMREVLLARGFEAATIRTLVSRSNPAAEPTRSNILLAMGQLTLQIKPGDRVVLYLSGHSSQQPQPAMHGKRPTEPDGLDEVFLPADVRLWDGVGNQAAIPNALLDDEIGEWIDAVVDRGAVVWAIFDTCHAAGMARGSNRTRWRAVSPAELGVATTTQPARAATSMGRNDGRVLLHAARAHELTGEEWLPKGAAMARMRVHGVFTFHLAAILKRQSTLDAKQIEQAVTDAYRAEGRVGPRPSVRGDQALLLP